MTIISNDVLTLRSGAVRCAVAPRAGGALAGFWWERAGGRIDWLRPATMAAARQDDAGAMSCFPLVPWSNRIRDGVFAFGDRKIVAARDEEDGPAHAMHGHGWRRPWRVVERGEDRLVLDYVHEPEAPAWPWVYRASQTVALSPEALSLTLEIENLSSSLMPGGLGFHPFFPDARGASLTASAKGIWQTDDARLPTEWAALSPELALTGRRPATELGLDNVFTGWDGRAIIAWPEQGRRLSIEAEQPILSFLTVYTPSDHDFFCVEPVSHCTDAFNLARAGIPDTGIRVLAPGARRRAAVTLRPLLSW